MSLIGRTLLLAMALGVLLPGRSEAQGACSGVSVSCDGGHQVACSCDGSYLCSSLTGCADRPFCNPVGNVVNDNGILRSNCCKASWTCNATTELSATTCTEGCTKPPQPCTDGKCACGPSGERLPTIGDPVNAVTGESLLVETDLELAGGAGPLKLTRYFTSAVNTWLLDAVVRKVPKPFGGSVSNSSSLHWWHNYFSFVRVTTQRWTVVSDTGALTRFTPCAGTSCSAVPTASSFSKRERLQRTANGFVLMEAGGRKLHYEARHVEAGGTQERYFLSRVVSPSGVAVAQLAYALPSGLTCPQGNTGSGAGVPYLASVSGPTGALDFQYVALSAGTGDTQCVVRSVTRRGEPTPSVTYAYKQDSGSVERPGQVVLATTASGVRGYAYSSASLEASLGSLLVVKHDYRADGTVSSVTAAEGEQLALGTEQSSTCLPGSNCCGAQPRRRDATDGFAGRGDGQVGAAGFVRSYETLTDTAQSVAPRLYQTAEVCGVAGACSPGSERYEWECGTSTLPPYEKARKNKRDAWEVFTYASPATGTGVPAAVLEKTSVKKGAQDMSGTGALEEETFSYTYGPNGEQLLATSEKPSVLGAAGQRARTFHRHDGTGRRSATFQSGWTRGFDAATGTWSSQQRWHGTFFLTTRTGESTPDPLGRTLEMHGPCQVASEAATDCDTGTVFPVTRNFYWSDTETSARRNRLQKVAVYPAGLTSAPLETLYNAYDAAGNVTESVDAIGVTTLSTWRDAQLLTQTVRVTGQADVVTGYGYDEAGHRAWVRHPEGNHEVFCFRQGTAVGSGCTGGTMTDQLQWKAKSATQDGATWSEKVTFTYWPDGTLREARYLDGAGTPRKLLSYAADAHRRPTWQQWGQGAGSFTSARSYDGANNQTGEGQPFNAPPAWCAVGVDGQPGSAACSAMQYDRANRLVRVDEHPTATTTARTCQWHDAHGNVTGIDVGLPSTTDCATATPSAQASRYQYDDFGNLVEATLAATGSGGTAGATRFAHDAQGNTVVKQTPAMVAVHARDHLASSYDAMGRELAVQHVSPALPGGAEVLYAMGYDAAASPDASCGTPTHTLGRMRYRDDSFGRTWYSYDAWGRTVKEVRLRTGTSTCSGATPFQNPHTLYAYSLNGNLTQVTHPYGRVVTYVHGTGGLVDRVSAVNVLTWGSSGTSTTPLLSQVAWEPYGGVRGYRMHHAAAGTSGSVEYMLGDNASQPPTGCPTAAPSIGSTDGTGRIRALWVSSLGSGSYTPGTGNGAVLKQVYTWQADQLVRSDSCLLGASAPRTETYAYDGLLRLTGATGTLATEGGAFGSRAFGHDARGNRTSESGEAHGWALAYTSAGHPDRLVSRNSTQANAQLGYSYEYDADGRVSRKVWRPAGEAGAFHSLTFASGPSAGGASDTVFKAVNVNGATFNYFYDAQGRRRLKDYPTGVKDEYFYDLGHGLLVDQGHAYSYTATTVRPVDEYVWLDSRPVAVIRGRLDASWAHVSDSTADCTRRGEAAACGIYHLVTDYLGKPVLMLDSQGRVAGTGEYDAFGHVNRVSVDAETAHPYVSTSGAFGTVMKQPHLAGASLQQRVLFDAVDLWTDFEQCGDMHSQNRNDTVFLRDEATSASLASVSYLNGSGFWTPWVTPGAAGVRPVLNNLGLGTCTPAWSCNGIGCVPAGCNCSASTPLKDDRGVVIPAYEYRRFQTGATPFWTPLRQPGQYHDTETDLFENWNRYYDPGAGRYLQPEPLLVSGPVVRPAFAYALNNPLYYVDATGLDACVYAKPGGPLFQPSTWHVGIALENNCRERDSCSDSDEETFQRFDFYCRAADLTCFIAGESGNLSHDIYKREFGTCAGLALPGENVVRLYADCEDTAQALARACEQIKNRYSIFFAYTCVNYVDDVMNSLGQ